MKNDVTIDFSDNFACNSAHPVARILVECEVLGLFTRHVTIRKGIPMPFMPMPESASDDRIVVRFMIFAVTV